MPKKLPIEKIKAALQEYKAKFTPGFYHGSPSPNIKAFDSTKAAKDELLTTPGVTFVTRDPEFAESFLPMTHKGQYQTGATMYPVSVNLGKHFDASTPEGEKLIRQYAGNTPLAERLLESSWTEMESPAFLDMLKSKGYETFKVQEGGLDNVGIFNPKNIRGKFGKFDPAHAESPDFMKAQGGLVHLADAGSVAKAVRKLAPKFGETMDFVHFSKAPNISKLDPSFYGKGIKGAEAERLSQALDIKPRSYFYKDTPNVRPEPGLGPYKYKGTATDIYPLHSDPEGYGRMAKEMSMDEYLASQGIQQVDRDRYLNNLERMIKQGGYSGYASGDTGLLFYPTDVLPVK